MADRSRTDGVSVALAVLQALGRSHGTVALADLAAMVPRSSLHRVVRTLEAAGIVTRRRGTVSVGPLAGRVIGAQALRLRNAPVPPVPSRPCRLLETGDEGKGPIALSRPLRCGPQRRRFRIGFSNISLDNPWRVTLVHCVERAAANLVDGIGEFIVRHADNSAERQAADIADLVDGGADGLIVSAAASPNVRAAIEQAMARGVEVVMVDRGMRDLAPTSFVSTSDTAIGKITAQWLAETLGGTGGLILLPGSESTEPAQKRLAAALAVFSTCPGIEILDTAWTDWQRELGHRRAVGAIERFGRRISGVWCDSGLQGVGSMQAFSQCGWRSGTIPPHTGGDLNLAYKLAIRHRIRLAAVDYPPAMGMRAVDVLFQALHGRHVPSRVDVPLEIILTRGGATPSVVPHLRVEDHVRWDLPDDLVLASGLGQAYSPRAFRIHYRGNVYNRSAALPARHTS